MLFKNLHVNCLDVHMDNVLLKFNLGNLTILLVSSTAARRMRNSLDKQVL